MRDNEGLVTKITYIGGPTALIEIGGVRLLTDPTFDPAGTDYKSTKKLIGPAISAQQIGRIDVVLLSHDEHPDNLDAAGRSLLGKARTTLTTPTGAKRLGGNAVGLKNWQDFELKDNDGNTVTITGTPARHGPEGCESKLGEVTGFVVSPKRQDHGAIYFSGDTVWYEGIAEVGRRSRIGTALINLGAVQIDSYGPERLTMSADEAVQLAKAFGLHTLIPLHYEGWAHYRESREKMKKAFTSSGLDERVRWLTPGVSTRTS
jgi:L-ascorbate metabolism protein UlaG (beta-lactamase superfamily)